jgi:hypothetical protein
MLDQLRDETFAGLEDAYGPAVDVPNHLDRTTEYRVQRLVAELARPIEVRSGGSSLRAG